MCCGCNKTIISICIALILLLIAIFVIVIIINNNNIKEPNILVAIAKPGDNTTVGPTTIKFSENNIVEGTAISHTEGSDEVIINETGIYQISYQLDGVGQAVGTFNFNAILLVNDTPLEDTLNEGPVIREDFSDRMTLTSTVILRLNSGDVLNLGGISLEDVIYERARIDIEKIG